MLGRRPTRDQQIGFSHILDARTLKIRMLSDCDTEGDVAKLCAGKSVGKLVLGHHGLNPHLGSGLEEYSVVSDEPVYGTASW